MTLAAAIKKLQVAARRLEDGQGRIARRNARRAVAQAQRALRAVVDREFPSVPRSVSAKAPPRATRDEIQKRAVRRMRRAGFLPAAPANLVTAARAGIRPRSAAGQLWVPEWIVDLGMTSIPEAQLRRARRDTTYRKALLASLNLKQIGETPLLKLESGRIHVAKVRLAGVAHGRFLEVP